MNIQWYPGHMARTRRQLEQDLKGVDLVAEIVDARIPRSSRNPDLEELCRGKPRLVILNRADQAEPAGNRAWSAWLGSRGQAVLETDARSGRGTARFSAAAREALAPQLERWRERGQTGRPVRVMVAGIPNVGKSTFINQVARRRLARAEDRPGVTRGRQWVHVDAGLELLDTAGILWPRLEGGDTGLHLAFTGAVKDDILDRETLACHLMARLARDWPDRLRERLGLQELPPALEGEDPVAWGYRLLEAAARRRGMRISGGEWDTERMARVLLDEFRGGKLGRFTLEWPEEGRGHGAGSVEP